MSEFHVREPHIGDHVTSPEAMWAAQRNNALGHLIHDFGEEQTKQLMQDIGEEKLIDRVTRLRAEMTLADTLYYTGDDGQRLLNKLDGDKLFKGTGIAVHPTPVARGFMQHALKSAQPPKDWGDEGYGAHPGARSAAVADASGHGVRVRNTPAAREIRAGLRESWSDEGARLRSGEVSRGGRE